MSYEVPPKLSETWIGMTLKIVWFAFLYCAGFMLVTWGTANVHGRINCSRLESAAGVQTRFDWVGVTCYVRVGERWVPRDAWRVGP